jgi:hypothetical protein
MKVATSGGDPIAVKSKQPANTTPAETSRPNDESPANPCPKAAPTPPDGRADLLEGNLAARSMRETRGSTRASTATLAGEGEPGAQIDEGAAAAFLSRAAARRDSKARDCATGRADLCDAPLSEPTTKSLQMGLQERARELAEKDPAAFMDILTQAYGSKCSPKEMQWLLTAAQQGRLPLPSNVVFVDSSVLGDADAAYSPENGGSVYLSEDLRATPDALQRVFNEEVGHHIDRLLGNRDAVGDEGLLFATGLAQGGPLAEATVKAMRQRCDHGIIAVDGTLLQVEFHRSDATWRYEATGGFSEDAIRTLAKKRLAADVDQAMLDAYAADAPKVSTIDELKRHLEQLGIDYAGARAEIEYELLSDYAGADTQAQPLDELVDASLVQRFAADHPDVRSVADVERLLSAVDGGYPKARAEARREVLDKTREPVLTSMGDAIQREAGHAFMLARLSIAGILGETTTLDTPLDETVQARVDGDPVLGQVEPPITRWGQLLAELEGDLDADGKADYDAFQLSHFLPHTTQQELLRALTDPVEPGLLTDRAIAAGLISSSVVDSRRGAEAGRLRAPSGFGLQGASEIDRVQQQYLLRSGKIFADTNANGEVDPNDMVHWIDQEGQVRETRFKDLDASLRSLVRFNMATANACEQYAALPYSQQMRFPFFNSETGRSQPDKVNERFWKVSTATRLGGAVSWELQPEARPCDAIEDIFSGNGGMYTTECAQGRTLMRLKGLKDYLVSEHGQEAGRLLFDATFGKDRSAARKAREYVQGFADFQRANPTKGWADYAIPSSSLQRAIPATSTTTQ